MKKEVLNHIQHLGVTFDRLLNVLFTEKEMDLMTQDLDHFSEYIATRSRWVKVDDLVIPNVTTGRMVLIHLLWFQSIGRVVIEDIDPFSGAILLHLHIERKDDPILS